MKSLYADVDIPKVLFVPYLFHSLTYALDYDDEKGVAFDLTRNAVVSVGDGRAWTYERLREDTLRVRA